MAKKKWLSGVDAAGKQIINLPAPTAGSTEPARQVDLETARSFAISRANHVGNQDSSTISNFVPTVQGIAINTLAAPTAPLNINAQRLTNVATPTTGTDGANKQYVDDSITGLTSGQTFKNTVRALVKTNVNVASPGATLDGVTAAVNDVFWLGAQTTGSERGPWVFNGATSAMTRPANWNTAARAVVGSYWLITGGTTPDAWLLMTNDSFVLGTDTAAYKVIDVAAASTPPYAIDIGNNAATQFAVAHNLGTRDVHVQVRRNASPFDDVTAGIYFEYTDANTITFMPDEVLTAAQFRVVIAKM